jgi:hypothetical protein
LFSQITLGIHRELIAFGDNRQQPDRAAEYNVDLALAGYEQGSVHLASRGTRADGKYGKRKERVSGENEA